MSHQPISTSSEWTFDLLLKYDQEIAKCAKDFGLDTYPNQIEIVTSEQMLDAYSSIGLPVIYHHWSFGKHFIVSEQQYKHGYMGLAYELVINSNPCIAYLLEENTVTMQALVIAHACYGHNSFFKNNYLFKTWTNADAIVDYLVFAKSYIAQCEERYGVEAVENLLDACHALMNYGVDRYKRPSPLSADAERERQKRIEHARQQQFNELWRTIPKGEQNEDAQLEQSLFPNEPQENLLYFFEKHSPLLEIWEKEIIRIVRKLAQYFYPQRQTKVMNEGWATFWHYTLINNLYDKGLLTDGFMFEFLQAHTNVVYQPDFDSPYYSGINPYALGFAIFSDIKRICQNPTEEDEYWFPHLVNTDWSKQLDFAMRNFKDESFVAQYLSPKVIRDFRLFNVLDDSTAPEIMITAIHDDMGYRAVRRALADQYNVGSLEPNIQIYSVNTRGDRSIILRHYRYHGRPLGKTTESVLQHLYYLWKFPIRLESIDETGEVESVYHYPD